MVNEDLQQLFINVIRIFEKSQYNLSTPLLGSGGCFDLIAKKSIFLILVKMLQNIDNLKEEQAFELKKLSAMLSGLPIIIGQKIRNNTDIENGVVYTRYEIPAISLETLQDLLVHNLPPLIFAERGGFKVKFNGGLLKEKRINRNYSLNDLARKVGISKRAIYEYEHGSADVSLEKALLIEEILDSPLTLAINLFEEMRKIGSLLTPSMSENIPKNDLEKDVKVHFDEIGLRDQLWTKKTPFRVIAKPLPQNEEIKKDATITGITRELTGQEFIKKIQITYNISKITDTNALVVVGENINQTEIEGVPIISIEKLLKQKRNVSTHRN